MLVSEYPFKSNVRVLLTFAPMLAMPLPKALVLPRLTTRLPNTFTVPLPEMLLSSVTLSERLNVRLELLTTKPVPNVPAVAPLPTCKVPEVMVVVPL